MYLSDETIERLAESYVEALRTLVAHCQSPDAGGYTPSDFAEFGWSEEDFGNIVSRISRSVERR